MSKATTTNYPSPETLRPQTIVGACAALEFAAGSLLAQVAKPQTELLPPETVTPTPDVLLAQQMVAEATSAAEKFATGA